MYFRDSLKLQIRI